MFRFIGSIYKVKVVPLLPSTRISPARGSGYALDAFHGRVLHLILDHERTWVRERIVGELMRKAKFSESLKADQVCRSYLFVCDFPWTSGSQALQFSGGTELNLSGLTRWCSCFLLPIQLF